MNIAINSIFYPLLISILPIGILYYEERKSTYFKTGCWSFLSGMISIILFMIVKIKYSWWLVVGATVLGFLVNMGFVSQWIHSKKFFKLLLVLGIFFFISILQYIPIFIFQLDPHHLTNQTEAYLTLYTDIILLIILFFLYRQEIKMQLKDFKKNFYQYVDVGFKYWLIGLIVMVGSNLLITLFSPNAIAGNENQVQALIHGAPLASFICIGLIAPIIEEFIFRKAFYDAFSKKWLFVLISGVVFGGLHIVFSYQSAWDFLYLIPYCSLGIAFACALAKTKNIFTSISLHMFHNTCLTLLSIMGNAAIAVILW